MLQKPDIFTCYRHRIVTTPDCHGSFPKSRMTAIYCLSSAVQVRTSTPKLIFKASLQEAITSEEYWLIDARIDPNGYA